MKKKFLSFILAICLILPCMFMLTACGEDSNKRKVSLDNSFKQSNILDVGLVEKTQEGSFNFDNTNTMYSCDEEGNIYNDLDIKVEWKTSNIHLYLRLKEGYCLVDPTDGKDYIVEHSNGNIKDGGLQAIKYNGPTYYVSMIPILGYDCDYLLKLKSTVEKEQKEISFSYANYDVDTSFTNARFKIALNNEYYKVDDETKVFNITEFAEFLDSSFEAEMTVDGKVDYDSTLKFEIYFVDGNGNVDTSKMLKYQDYSHGLFEKHYTDEFGTNQIEYISPTTDEITGEILRENGVYTFETFIMTDSTIKVNWNVFDDTIITIENEEIWNNALSLHTLEQVKYIDTANNSIGIKYGDAMYFENDDYFTCIIKNEDNYNFYDKDEEQYTSATQQDYDQSLNLFNFSNPFKFDNFQFTGFTDPSTNITVSYYENIETIVIEGKEYTNVKLMFENEKIVKMSYTLKESEESSTDVDIEITYTGIDTNWIPDV